MELIVTERSHSYWIDCGKAYVKSTLWKYLRKITSVKWETERGKKFEVYDQCYAARSPCGRYVGLLRPAYEQFLKEVKFHTGTEPTVKLTKMPPSSEAKVNFKIKKGVKFKDEEQEQAYKFLQEDKFMHVLECATGFGKTFLGLYSSAKLGSRTIFLMQAKHIKTWLADIEQFIEMDKNDVGIIRGRDSLILACKLQAVGKYDKKFIFISSETFREYIKCYEKQEEYCDVKPPDFCNFFNVTRVVRDEAHEALYNLVKQTIYLNVETLLCLSATIVSESPFITRMYELTFPKLCRWKSKNNTHIDAFSVRYTNEYGMKIRSSTGYGYSHIRYEKDLMMKGYLKRQYFKMITDVMHNFDLDYEKGMKVIVFCALKDTCSALASELKKIYTDLVVNYYVAETDKKVLDESDVIVTTIGSCGTGTNIVDLAHSYNTVAVGSKKQAWQTMGRLRQLKNYKGKFPKYYFFSNMTIPAHRKFENIRRVDLLDKTRSLKVINLGCTITKNFNA